MEGILLVLIVCSVSGLGTALVYKIGTATKLKRHEQEWQRIKLICAINGMGDDKISDAYFWYISILYVEEHGSFLGCCFPRER